MEGGALVRVLLLFLCIQTNRNGGARLRFVCSNYMSYVCVYISMVGLELSDIIAPSNKFTTLWAYDASWAECVTITMVVP